MATFEDGYWTLLSPPFQSQPRTMINSNTGNDRMMMMMMLMMMMMMIWCCCCCCCCCCCWLLLLLLLLLTGIMWVNVRVPPTMFGRTSKRLVSDLLAWTYVVPNQDVATWQWDIPHLVRCFFPLKPLFLDDFFPIKTSIYSWFVPSIKQLDPFAVASFRSVFHGVRIKRNAWRMLSVLRCCASGKTTEFYGLLTENGFMMVHETWCSFRSFRSGILEQMSWFLDDICHAQLHFVVTHTCTSIL